MVYYVRFLKPPRPSAAKPPRDQVVKAVVTVTSDLGDEFCPQELTLTAFLIHSGGQILASTCHLWTSNMRVLKVEHRVRREQLAGLWRLCVGTQTGILALDPLRSRLMPEIVTAWSDTFEMSKPDDCQYRVQRRFDLGHKQPLCIWEETGESIARHVWDAGIGLAAELMDKLTNANDDTSCSFGDLKASGTSRHLNVLELGSGCGIAGLALAQLRPNCRVLLTDLAAAMDILDANIKGAILADDCVVERSIVDWDQELPDLVRGVIWDLILISDCTYNADSLPALVRTLRDVTRGSTTALILVSMKIRHASEAVFFDLMKHELFKVIEHETIVLPDPYKTDAGLQTEQVEIYTFQLQAT